MYIRATTGTQNHETTAAREQVVNGALLGAWLGILLLLFVGAGIFSYLPCASFAELGLFALFLVTLSRNGWRWRKTPLDGLIVAVLGLQALGTAWGYLGGFGAHSPYAPGPYAGGAFGPLQLLVDQCAACAACYLAIWRTREPLASQKSQYPPRLSRDPMLFSLVLAAGVVLFLCLLEWAIGFIHKPDDPRIKASFGNANLLASYLVLMALPLLGASLTRACGNQSRISFAFLAAGLLFALFLAQSRGAWIGVALGLAFAGATLWVHAGGQAKLRHRGGLAIGIFAACGIAAFLFGAFIAPKIGARWHGHSEEERHIIWNAALTIIQAHPVLGVGVGGFPAAMASLGLKQLNDFTPDGHPLVPAVHLHAHNLLLEFAAEKGVAGLALGLCLIFAILGRCAVLLAGRRPMGPLLPIAAGLGAGLIALLTQCVADYTLWYAPVLILTWLVLGFFFALQETGMVTDKQNLGNGNNFY
ncbi:MAG TPA: O-antigen ligase family protein [Capsulimonadaceae bacterium]|nr:O-antigen ligase family protein [Capsulimonadaceae bacterium]